MLICAKFVKGLCKMIWFLVWLLSCATWDPAGAQRWEGLRSEFPRSLAVVDIEKDINYFTIINLEQNESGFQIVWRNLMRCFTSWFTYCIYFALLICFAAAVSMSMARQPFVQRIWSRRAWALIFWGDLLQDNLVLIKGWGGFGVRQYVFCMLGYFMVGQKYHACKDGWLAPWLFICEQCLMIVQFRDVHHQVQVCVVQMAKQRQINDSS